MRKFYLFGNVFFICFRENASIMSAKSLFPNRFFQSLFVSLLIYGLYCHFSWSKIVYIVLPAFLFSLVENISGISGKLISNAKSIFTDYRTTSLSFLALPFVGLFGLCKFRSFVNIHQL